jgi:hypothetical protein
MIQPFNANFSTQLIVVNLLIVKSVSDLKL